MAEVAPAVLPRRRGWFFRVAFPLLLVAALLTEIYLPRIWEWADFDPAPLLGIYMFGMWGVPLSILLLLIWLLALSGFRWRTRLTILSVVVGLVGVWIASIAEVEVNGDVGLLITYKWQKRPAPRTEPPPEKTTPSDLPRINLTIDPMHDFPRYRGTTFDGVVRGLTLAKDWKTHPPREIWRHALAHHPAGFSGFAVAGNVAVTLEQRDDKEAVVCYERATGRELWAYAYEAKHIDPMGNGPRATPTIDGGDVFSLGATGWLVCLNGKTGGKNWAVNILEDNQARNITWALSGSPLVHGDRVIVNPGIDPANNVGRGLAAYDRKSGKRIWGSGSHAAGYSSPQLATLLGREQVLLFDAGGLAGFDPASGKELWRYPWTTFQGMNIIQPLVFGDDRVLISSETSNGCAMLRVSESGGAYAVEPVWANRKMVSKFCNPLAIAGHIYGLSLNYLVCLDERTGERCWQSGRRYGHGQLLAVGDSLLVQDEFGELALVAADSARWHELGRVRIFDDPKIWNTPALAGGRLFLRDHMHMACYELPVDKEP
jgi:outer membrane protein assembly factor BamB